MKRLILLTVLAALANVLIFAQSLSTFKPLVPLSESQLSKLASVAEAKAPLMRGPMTLPVMVDNSTQPYFRPLFTQSGLECGQASSIGLGLTYELDLKRLAPANISQNQYATYFTYNFINGGSDAGVSFLESWEIVKRCGNPSVFDYGGLSAGGSSRWMTGYDKYYNAMHNRITDVAVIYLTSVEGLNTLKSWIHNHMDQATIGGVAHFYSQYGSVDNQLPPGTPQAGQYVLTTWGSSPNHAMTILGYNDSIRWDYNGDGQYTNNIDLNGDGILNLKDWEIGGFKIANTYGNVGNWANQGFAWATYKSFADNPASGGIWNNAAYIAYAKQDLTPKLTMKVSLKHTSRNKLRVIAGVSNDLAATEPDVTLNLPIFDYQGGDKYMQGGSTEADKTIEMGLDVTPLLSEIVSGQPAKFFLIVQENDPFNTATGQIVDFDMIDYTNGVVPISGSSTNVPLVENGETSLSITATLNISQPSITTTSLPEAKIYEPYSHQLTVSGGTSPYKWRLMTDYSETAETCNFPTVNGQQLTVNSSSSGYASQNLPFAFPFYGKSYTKVFPHVDGYLMFEDHPVPWPYIIYERTFFKNTRCISPYMGKPLVLEGSDNDGIWYQGNADSACFRWKVSVYGATASTDINIVMTLYPDGKINFYYGTVNSSGSLNWIAGISNGDGVNYKYTAITDSLAQPTPNTLFSYTTQPFPTEMSLSDYGIFSGTPSKTYVNLPIKFYVEDNNFLHDTRTLNFNTKGVEISYQVTAGNDSIIEFGENVFLTPTLRNVSNMVLHNVVMKLGLNDNFIISIDSTQNIGTLNPGQVLTLPNAFHFSVLNSIPDMHLINLYSQVLATEENFNLTIQLPARAAKLEVVNVSVSDGNNNILMPGETGNILISLKNSGGSDATGLTSLLTSIDPYITIVQGNFAFDTLSANTTTLLNFAIQVTPSCPNGHIGYLNFTTEADKDLLLYDSLFIPIGNIVEDFETGNFTRFPWQKSGNSDWSISLTTPYEGTFCAESGSMIDNQECSLFLELEVLSASEISFYRKVSSEVNYDFLYFYIDGAEMGKWSGDVPWSKVTFPVPAGNHIFKWKYGKDYSVSSGSDKAWIDYISWPPLANYLLIAYAGPDDIACSGQHYPLAGQVLNASSMFWSGNGDGTFMNINSPNALYLPGPNDLATGQVILTIHASQLNLPSVVDEVILDIIQGPEVNAGPDLAVCPENSITISQAVSSNASSVLWSSSGDGNFDTPSLLTATYTPGANDILNGQATLTLTALGSSDCGPSSDALILMIYPEVVTNAGNDQTISYNTSALLSGTASGGGGTFTPEWEPSALLINPTIFNPTTVNLVGSQVFTLTATSNLTGCQSSDEVTVSVSGGPLGVTATATPENICPGGTSQLSAIAGGGSGAYTYLWTSNPAGFSSTLPNPVVNPIITTVYTVELNDGFASVFGQTTVTVNTIPLVPGKPVGPASVNTYLIASTSYSTQGPSNATAFEWVLNPTEAGSLNTSGNSCEVAWNLAFEGLATLKVNASNICGASAFSETLNILIGPEVSLPELAGQLKLKVYPNPGKGDFSISLSQSGKFDILVTDLQGRHLESKLFDAPQPGSILQLDLKHLGSGVYFLLIRNGSNLLTERIEIIK